MTMNLTKVIFFGPTLNSKLRLNSTHTHSHIQHTSRRILADSEISEKQLQQKESYSFSKKKKKKGLAQIKKKKNNQKKQKKKKKKNIIKYTNNKV